MNSDYDPTPARNESLVVGLFKNVQKNIHLNIEKIKQNVVPISPRVPKEIIIEEEEQESDLYDGNMLNHIEKHAGSALDQA